MKMQAQVIIKTIAGQGLVSGFSGDSGPATSGLLYNPETVCLDKYGNIYTTDAGNQRIRRIDAISGTITSIAGNGAMGFSGDDGPATNASFFFPTGMTIDTAGNIYISDVLNYRVRKISSKTGIITTIVGVGKQGNTGNGGLATNAKIGFISGLCLDKNNNIIIADNDYHVLRKIDFNSGIITVIAGTGFGGYSGDEGPATSAQLNEPGQPFSDINGNLFVTDMLNNVVRKIDAITGIITTIAGTGALGYSGDGGPATNAKMNQPYGVFIDAQNNIFVSEYWNGVVRKIDAKTKIITTVAGKDTIGYGGDGGPATDARMAPGGLWVDHHGTIFIADEGNHCIRKVYDSSQHYTGMASPPKEREVLVYPNPATKELIIEGAEGSEATICNMLGQSFDRVRMTTNKERVDISKLSPAMYIIQIISPTGDKEIRRFVKE